MLNYEEALSVAKSKKSKINKCIEYNKAFAFSYEDGVCRDGGDSPVVIMKDTGEAINFIEFAIMPDKEVVREFDIE